MPLYDYLCASCKKTTEVLQGFNEKPLRICPHCGGKLKKLASAPAIQFKGSGWYVTDYAGKSGSASDSTPEKSSERSEKPAAAAAESKGSKDSKAETKKSDKPSRKESGSKKD